MRTDWKTRLPASIILDKARQSGRVYQVGLNRRFAPVYKYAKELITAGDITPYLAHIKMNRGELKNPPWVSDTSITGGFLYESTFHLLDMCRFLMGEVDTCHDYCRIAGAIGCPNIVVVPSPRPAGISDEDVAHESVRVLEELSEIADRYGVRLAFEFLGFDRCSVTTLRQCNEIVKAAARDNVGMVLDTFHFFAGWSGLDSIDGIDPQKLFIFHINDAEDTPRKQLQDANRLFPVDGVIPLKEIIRRLRHIGYDGVASVELFRPGYWEWVPLKLAQTARGKTLKVIGSTSRTTSGSPPPSASVPRSSSRRPRTQPGSSIASSDLKTHNTDSDPTHVNQVQVRDFTRACAWVSPASQRGG